MTASNLERPVLSTPQEEAKALGLKEGMARGRQRLRECQEKRMTLGARYRAIVGRERHAKAILKEGLTTEELNLIATFASVSFDKVEAITNLALRKVADAYA